MKTDFLGLTICYWNSTTIFWRRNAPSQQV